MKKRIIDFLDSNYYIKLFCNYVLIVIFAWILAVLVARNFNQVFGYIQENVYTQILLIGLAIYFIKDFLVFVVKIFSISWIDKAVLFCIVFLLVVGRMNFYNFYFDIRDVYIIIFCVFLYLTVYLILYNQENNSYSKSFFRSRKAILRKDDDLLDISDQAIKFADIIVNNCSSDSVVFGLESPWGFGKTTFMNFVKERWKSLDSEFVVINFQPISYSTREVVAKQLIDNILGGISRYNFAFEQRKVLNKLLSSIGIKVGFLDNFLSLNFIANNLDVNEVGKLIENLFEKLGLKIVVIIDDLDRRSFFKIKNIVSVIEDYLGLRGVKFVLCYSNSNIDFENDSSVNLNKYKIEDESNFKFLYRSESEYNNNKICEYFEKYFDVKFVINFSRTKLCQFFAVLLNEYAIQVVMNDLHYRKIQEMIKNLLINAKLLNNPRRIIQYINHLKLLNIGDLSLTDYSYDVVLYLLFIKLHYSELFTMLYLNEVGENKVGEYSFSVGDKKFMKPKMMNDILKLYSGDDYRSLVLDFFTPQNEQITGDFDKDKIDMSKWNGFRSIKGAGKLFLTDNKDDRFSRHLELVQNIKIGDLDLGDYLQYYLEKVNDFIRGTIVFEDIINSKKDNDGSEKFLFMLFRAIKQRLNELSRDKNKSKEIMGFLVSNVNNFSIIDPNKSNFIFGEKDILIGFRLSASYYLAVLLNNFSDVEINKYIFDELLKNMGNNPSFNVLNLHDLLEFRLICSHDQMGDFWKIYEALRLDVKDELKDSNIVREFAQSEMRKISQKIFMIFKEKYIDNKLNIFQELDDLTFEKLFGSLDKYDYTKNQINDDNKIDEIISRNKLSIINFIFYQLANDLIGSGVGVGLYDELGNGDKHGIKRIMNDYLFNICFKIECAENIVYFLDYLLGNLVIGSRSEECVPNFKNYLKVFHKNLLLDYWHKNNEQIKRYVNDISKDKIVYTANYYASYKEDLPAVFNLLDFELETKMLVERDRLIKILNFIKEKKDENTKEKNQENSKDL